MESIVLLLPSPLAVKFSSLSWPPLRLDVSDAGLVGGRHKDGDGSQNCFEPNARPGQSQGVRYFLALFPPVPIPYNGIGMRDVCGYTVVALVVLIGYSLLYTTPMKPCSYCVLALGDMKPIHISLSIIMDSPSLPGSSNRGHRTSWCCIFSRTLQPPIAWTACAKC